MTPKTEGVWVDTIQLVHHKLARSERVVLMDVSDRMNSIEQRKSYWELPLQSRELHDLLHSDQLVSISANDVSRT